VGRAPADDPLPRVPRGYIGISVPVIALGVALQHASTRVTLLGFAIVVGAGIVAANPTLAGRHMPRLGTAEKVPGQ